MAGPRAARARALPVLIALAILLLAAPIVVSSYWVGLLTQMVIFSILAMSLDILLGYTGLPSLGHAGVFGVAFDACAPNEVALVIANIVATDMVSRDRSIMDLAALGSRVDGSIRPNTRDRPEGRQTRRDVPSAPGRGPVTPVTKASFAETLAETGPAISSRERRERLAQDGEWTGLEPETSGCDRPAFWQMA